MSAAAEPRLRLDGVVKHFPLSRGALGRRPAGAVHAVDGVSLEVRRGETLGLVGESGCGKSTLARLMTRLIEPGAGTIRFRGQDISHLGRKQLRPVRRDLQMVFQDPYGSLNPRRPVGAIVAEPFAVHGLLPGAGERRRAVQELMERVGLNPEHYNRYPHEFSGGQRQRVGVARAIALGPELIVADEPVSALDVSIQAQILNLLRDLQRDLGLAIVLIAHDLSVVRHMCDRVAVMYLGQVVELATADALYGHPRHPYTGALLAAVPAPRPGIARERGTAVPRGEPPDPADPPPACRFHTRCPKCADVCAREAPTFEPKGGGSSAACHFPLTALEATVGIPGTSRSVPGTG